MPFPGFFLTPRHSGTADQKLTSSFSRWMTKISQRLDLQLNHGKNLGHLIHHLKNRRHMQCMKAYVSSSTSTHTSTHTSGCVPTDSSTGRSEHQCITINLCINWVQVLPKLLNKAEIPPPKLMWHLFLINKRSLECQSWCSSRLFWSIGFPWSHMYVKQAQKNKRTKNTLWERRV